MEPALDERGDVMRTPVARMSRSQPQWSPLSTSGATTRAVNLDRPVVVWPQWSPLSTSGATGLFFGDVEAAMEPALDERGDASGGVRMALYASPQWSPLSTSGATPRAAPCATATRTPQWSPLSTSGATQRVGAGVVLIRGAAMEPALDERGDSGRRVARGGTAAWPQWSPLSTSGATLSRAKGGDGRTVAAMEPALDERGDLLRHIRMCAMSTPQWSPLSTSGATRWPTSCQPSKQVPQWSPLSTSGATTRFFTAWMWSSSRNGARSRRAGRPQAAHRARGAG